MKFAPPLAAFAATIILVPVVRSFCERAHVLDQPGLLKIHARPIPRLGGLAIFCGVLAGSFAASLQGAAASRYFLAALAFVWLTGFFDDLRSISPGFRLAAQILSATLLWLGGWRFPSGAKGPAAFTGTALFVVLCVNAFNFLDGSDGLAAGVACICALAYIVLPRTMLTPAAFGVALSMAAACAAFLFFNFPSATIFLGDSGSTVLGFLAAFLGLDFEKANAAASHLRFFPLIVIALPLLDAVRVVALRLAHLQSPFLGDRSHFYDRLLVRGYSSRRVAVLCWSITAACGAIGVVSVRMNLSGAWSIFPLCLAAVWIASVVAIPRREISSREEKGGFASLRS